MRKHRIIRRCVWVMSWTLWLIGGCAGRVESPPRTQLGQHQSAIMNGQPSLEHPAVGAIVPARSRPFCSGTLIASKWVLTAAHCVPPLRSYATRTTVNFRIDLPDGKGGFTRDYYPIKKANSHPQYARTRSSTYDIAVLELSNAVPGVTPIPFNTMPMDQSWVGKNVKVMGYGLIKTYPSAISPNRKYTADIPIYRVSSGTFIHFDQSGAKKSACHGDSGGPALMMVNGQIRVVGITSTSYRARQHPNGNPPTLCDGGAVDNRPDNQRSFIESFVGTSSNKCKDGQQRTCYNGPAGTQGVGLCKPGTQSCSGGQWGACAGEVGPQKEACDNKDNNCNGQIDETCACRDGQTQSCYDGATGTQGQGVCKEGTRTCKTGQWGGCVGQTLPSNKEICNDGKDDNCNGQVDEGCIPPCKEGETDLCYTGSVQTWGVGRCRAGNRTCRAGKWSQCENEVKPAAKENCGDGVDDNCDGQVDEGCPGPPACANGSQEPCYSGAAATRGIGACRVGTKLCTNGKWGVCTGEVGPTAQEVCGNQIDDNCNGKIDENCGSGGPGPNSGDPNFGWSARGSGCSVVGRHPPLSGFLSWISLLGIVLLGWRSRRRRSLRRRSTSLKSWCGLGFLLFLCLFCARSAHAQESEAPLLTAIQVQQFRPNADPRSLLQTQRAETLGQWRFFAGAMFHYGARPFFVSSRTTGREADVLRYQLGADLGVGLGVLSWLDMGIVVPMTLYQDGQIPPLALLGTSAGSSLAGYAMGDIRIRAKLRLLQQRYTGVSLALQPYLGLPSGDSTLFNGEGGPSFGVAALLSRAFSLGPRSLLFALNVGYRYQPETTFLDLIIGHEFFYRAGLGLDVWPRRVELMAELDGVVGLSGTLEPGQISLGASFGLRLYPTATRNVGIKVGASVGLLGGYGTPAYRVIAGLVWTSGQAASGAQRPALAASDSDGDGIADADDVCPKRPGPREESGCPLPDADGDGVPDKDDACPRTSGIRVNRGCPEGKSGPPVASQLKVRERPAPRVPLVVVDVRPDPDKDGLTGRRDRCPELWGTKRRRGCPRRVYVRLRVLKKRIYLWRALTFRRGYRLTRLSRKMLRQMAEMLKNRPELRVRIVVSLWSRSRRGWVKQRAKLQARSIRAYLVKRGIAANRLAVEAKRGRWRRRRSRTYVKFRLQD